MLQLIGFDGDDTLWHSEGYYRQANEEFAAIVGRYVDLADSHVHDSMLATRCFRLAPASVLPTCRMRMRSGSRWISTS